MKFKALKKMIHKACQLQQTHKQCHPEQSPTQCHPQQTHEVCHPQLDWGSSLKKITASILLLTFFFTNVVGTDFAWAAELIQMPDGQWQPVVDPLADEINPDLNVGDTPDDFFDENPLSPPTPEADEVEVFEIAAAQAVVAGNEFDFPEWTTGDIYYVAEGQTIQEVIDNEANAGDLVFIPDGIYHEHIVLKEGVSLVGESQNTIIDGDYAQNIDVILAEGGSEEFTQFIENLTIKGSGRYRSGSSSGVHIQEGAENIIISNNHFDSDFGYGVYIPEAQNILVQQNLFSRNATAIALENTNAIVRYNTIVRSSSHGMSARNDFSGEVTNNIIALGRFSPIFVYKPGNIGYYTSPDLQMTIENNIINRHGNYREEYHYTEALVGNLQVNPNFTDENNNNYTLQAESPAVGFGYDLPLGLSNALNRSSRFDINAEITEIPNGYRVTYFEGSTEDFLNDGTQNIDTTPPQITLLTNLNAPHFTQSSFFGVAFEVDGQATNKVFAIKPGLNHLSITRTDFFGNTSTVSFDVVLDNVQPEISTALNNDINVTRTPNIPVHVDFSDENGVVRMEYAINSLEEDDFIGIAVSSDFNITLPNFEGVNWVNVRVFDEAGNVRYAVGSITLDQMLPDLEIILNAGATSTNDRNINVLLNATDSGTGVQEYSYAFNSAVEGDFSAWMTFEEMVSIQLPNWEGDNFVNVRVRDGAGNVRWDWEKIIYDSNSPQASMSVGDGSGVSDSRTVALNITASDLPVIGGRAASGIAGFQYAINSQANDSFSELQPITNPFNIEILDLTGAQEVYIRVVDHAGNVTLLQETIVYNATPAVIEITSPSSTNEELYTFTYTIDGVGFNETWRLAPGENRLLTRANRGNLPLYIEHTVTLNQVVSDLPAMPEITEINGDLLEVRAMGGFTFNYYEDALFSISSPGNFEFFNLTVDGEGNLDGGALVFENGDRLLYEQGRAVYRLSPNGTTTRFYEDGSIAMREVDQSVPIRFAYRYENDAIVSILSLEGESARLYDADGEVIWIKKSIITDIRYDHRGILQTYIDDFGNTYHFRVTERLDLESNLLGYRSELASITLSSNASNVSIADILNDLDSYPNIRKILEEELPKILEYDGEGHLEMTETISGGMLEFTQGNLTGLVNDQGQSFDVQVNDVLGSPFSINLNLNGQNESQIFNDQGDLIGIKLDDGSVLSLEELNLNQITLADGSILTDIAWNGFSLTTYRRTFGDGSSEAFLNSLLSEQTDEQGNITRYAYFGGANHPVELEMIDGRVYQILELQNSDGGTDRVNQLIRIELPDGGRIEFKNGQVARYIQPKVVQLEATQVPELPNGEAYIPVFTFPNLELRGIHLDAVGNIVTGEILFDDGTQYLIRNNLLERQITADGQIIEFEEVVQDPFVAPARVEPKLLTNDELAYRDDLIEDMLRFFVPGVGLHELTGIPLDNFRAVPRNGDPEGPSDYSQSTLIGFWAEILVTIARGDYVTDRMSSAEALQALLDLTETYQDIQQQIGWNGLVAFFTIVETEVDILDPITLEPIGETETVISYENRFGHVGFGDALNLAVSLSTVRGALSGVDFGADNAVRNQILNGVNQILTAQEPGYAAFYGFDVQGDRAFRHSYNLASGQFQGSFDRLFNEFRTGVIWLAANYPQYLEAIDNLDITIRQYETNDGVRIDNATPFDGGTFQMTWPGIHVDESRYPEFDVALRNFLYSQAEFVLENEIPGLLSAGDNPGLGYEGKVGLPSVAETDDPLIDNVGSLYALASAFNIAPHYVLQFLQNIEGAFAGIRTEFGFVDAIRTNPVEITDPDTLETYTDYDPTYSDQYFGVDQTSFVLSLLRTSQNYFDNDLALTGSRGNFDNIYEGFNLNLNPVASAMPEAPTFGQNITPLYDGGILNPDGIGNGLIRQQAFIESIFDPDFGEGQLYDYLTPSGNFHHSEIEFDLNSETIVMTVKEFLHLPGREDAARSIYENVVFDLFDRATQQAEFYTPGAGYAASAREIDPQIGEILHVDFDFKNIAWPVGLWANYINFNLSEFDYIAVPIRLTADTDVDIRLKFEFKGMGEIYITPELTHEWQYIEIPIIAPVPDLTQIAVSIQSVTGQAISGSFDMGPLSAFSVRTSNNINWQGLVGTTEAALRNMLRQEALEQPGSGGLVERDEILEDFEIDSEGNLMSGTLRRANGEIQFFENGLLTKWVFPNGRTVLFEDGLATFVIDLIRGELEDARFYYDQSFLGEVRSFVIQENDRRREFNSSGHLETFVQDGYFVNFENGEINSFVTDKAIFTNVTFADNDGLESAHVTLNDGTEFDIDQNGEQFFDLPDGTRVYYEDSRIIAIETPTNGRAELTYNINEIGQILGVDVHIAEIQGEETIVTTMSLAEFIRQPGYELEAEHLLSEPVFDMIENTGAVGQFYRVGHAIAASTFITGNPVRVLFSYRRTSSVAYDLGLVMNNFDQHEAAEDYDFLSITLGHDIAFAWDQDYQLKIKEVDGRFTTLASFRIESLETGETTFVFPLAGKHGRIDEITLEPVYNPANQNQSIRVNIYDISLFSLASISENPWEPVVGITATQIQGMKSEIDNLNAVGAEIASGEPLVYQELVAFLDTPTRMIYQAVGLSNEYQLAEFSRMDGTTVELEGENVRRVTLSDGTINDYETTGNASTGSVSGPTGENSNDIEYQYGALRNITQIDGREYSISYEFDAEGSQITVVRDVLFGQERRFVDGQLISSRSDDDLETRYEYQNGELFGAQVFYNNRVLNSTTYDFINNETLITDEEGITWIYDRDGRLLRHLTADGYLFSYNDFSFESIPADLAPEDFKSDIFLQNNLSSVVLEGYETDELQILYDFLGLAEIRFRNGSQAVNVDLDVINRMKSGQIQIADGLLMDIQNYMPVAGRHEDGSFYDVWIPTFDSVELLQGEDGSFIGVKYQVGDEYLTYDSLGYLVQVQTTSGETFNFNYQAAQGGFIQGYDLQHFSQIDFNGVPFPREVTLSFNEQLTIADEGSIIAEPEMENQNLENGFLLAAFNESLLEWKVVRGSFHSDGDRLRLRNFLESLKEGQSITMMVYDDDNFSEVEEEIFVLLEGAGAGNVRQAAANDDNWFFFGNEALDVGEGAEQIGGESFSTLTETNSFVDLSNLSRDHNRFNEHPVFNDQRLFLSYDNYEEVLTDYSDFLVAYEPNKPNPEFHALTVYNTDSELLFTERVDGVASFYEYGRVRETYTREGELLYFYEYGCITGVCSGPEDETLIRVTLVKARSDAAAEVSDLNRQLNDIRVDAFRELAEQEGVAIAEITQSVADLRQQLAQQINNLQSIQFQEVEQCRRRWWGGKRCRSVRVEVPGVGALISEAQGRRANLLETQADEIARLPQALQDSWLAINDAIETRLTELADQEAAIFRDLFIQEITPVISDVYRRVLGRDPATSEISDLANQYETVGAIDAAALYSILDSSVERVQSEVQKASIISAVAVFLEQYLDAAESGNTVEQNNLLSSLQLNVSEVVNLNREDVAIILDWLETRDLHFGQSAFLSLKDVLSSRDVDVDMVTIGRESLLIDVLSGTINRFTEGDLLISVFALNRTAKIHGEDIVGVNYSLTDLIDLYATQCSAGPETCNLRIIVHVGGDHFAVISYADAEQIVYTETTKGISGESIVADVNQFMNLWDIGDGTGHLMVYRDQAIQEKVITDEQAQKIRGAFWPIFFAVFFIASLVFTAASIVVSFFSPTWGRILGYAAMITGIVSIVGNLVNFVVQGVNLVASQVTQQGVLATIRQGFVSIGTAIWESVRAVGSFIREGFTFVRELFTSGFTSFSNIGPSLTNIGNYIVDGLRVVINPATGQATAEGTATFGQRAVNMLISPAVDYAISRGLNGLGIDPRIARLAGAFVSGGVTSLSSETATFFQSGLQRFILQGVDEIGLHIGLPPPIRAGVSLITQTSIQNLFDGSGFNFNLDFTEANIRDILPDVVEHFVLGGFQFLAEALDLDPRIANLLGLPFSSVISDLIGGISTNNPIDLFDIIKDNFVNRSSLAGVISIGADLLGVNETALQSNSILNTVGTLFGNQDLFRTAFAAIGNLVLNPIDALLGIPGLLADGVRNINEYIEEQGLLVTIEEFATSLFSQQTIENIIQRGGFASVLGSAAQTTVALANGQVVRELRVSDDVVLHFDFDGNLVGKNEYGRAQFGEFVIDGLGAFAQVAGTLFNPIGNGYAAAIEIVDGGVADMSLSSPEGFVANIRPEGGFYIDIPGPGELVAEAGGFGLGSFVLKLIGFGVELTFDGDGNLESFGANVPSIPSGTSTGDGTVRDMFILSNGINNTAFNLFDLFDDNANSEPDYFEFLEDDLVALTHNDGDDTNDIEEQDVVISSIYWNLPNNLPAFDFLDRWADRIKDVLSLLLNTQIPFVFDFVVWNLQTDILRQYAAAQQNPLVNPVVAVGYSGGFAPLIEAVNNLNVPLTSVVGIGAATISLAEISDVLNSLARVAEYIADGDINSDELRERVESLFEHIPFVGDILGTIFGFAIAGIVELVEAIFDLALNSVSDAIDILEEGVRKILDFTRIQEFLRWQNLIGLQALEDQDVAIVNVWGEHDPLYETGIAGQMGSIGGIVQGDDRIFDIQIQSMRDGDTITAYADHYNYVRGIRDENDPNLLSEQLVFDDLVAEFTARLIEVSRYGVDAIRLFLLGQGATQNQDTGIWSVDL